MNSTTLSLEQMKNQYYKERRNFERFQNDLAKKIGWNCFYEIRPVDLTPEDNVSEEEFTKLEKLYNKKRELYWKVHEMEAEEAGNMDHHIACKKAYDFIDGFPQMEASNLLREHGLTTFGLISKLESNPNFIEEVLL